MTIPTRQQYRYVSVPLDIEINQQILPLRTNPEYGRLSLKGEDVCFLDEARCERVRMRGGSPVSESIDKCISGDRLARIASGISSAYGDPFVNPGIFSGEWVEIPAGTSYQKNRSEVLSALFPNGIYLSNPRSSTADFSGGMRKSEMIKLFKDIKDMFLIADFSGSMVTCSRSVQLTEQYYEWNYGQPWKATSRQTFAPGFSGWGLGVDYFDSLRDLFLYSRYGTTPPDYPLAWGAGTKEYGSYSGAYSFSPGNGYRLVGVVAILLIDLYNMDPATGHGYYHGIKRFAKARLFEATNNSVSVGADYFGDQGGICNELGLIGRNNLSAVPSGLPYMDVSCEYEADSLIHFIPLVVPDDFRTDISDIDIS